MKRKILLVSLLSVMCLGLSACDINEVNTDIPNGEIKEYVYIIQTEESQKCNNKAKLYYKLSDGSELYTYCLDSIKIDDYINYPIDLSEYLSSHNDVEELNKIINTLEYIDMYKDGGTKLYRDNGNTEFTNNGLTILTCNTVDGNKDIYIGSKSMNYEVGFCK